MTAATELLPLPESDGLNDIYGECHHYYYADTLQAYARANMEPLLAEVERLKRHAERQHAAYWRANRRAERLAEALREAAGEMASIGDAIGHDHPEARRIFTLRANLISARLAGLAQEDRNG
jgi:hypothetical protein